MFLSLYDEQERGRKWLMLVRLKPFSVGKFVINGFDFWKCGEFLCVVPVYAAYQISETWIMGTPCT
jgi:hypothetical protein